MKTITRNELIELLPCDESLLDESLAKFDNAVPIPFRAAGFTKHAVAEGWMTAKTVSENGRPAYVIGYHHSADGGLWIDMAQTLKTGADISVLFGAVDILVAKHRPGYVRMATSRRGMVHISQRFGYKADAVLMSKGCA